jgi:photosystem II stability/assembly factor-like uncharacterized protein
MLGKYRDFLMTAALVAAATACSAGASALPATFPAAVTAHTSPSAAAKPVEVLSVSFLSPKVGYLLGEDGQLASRVLMRKTVNGGKTWVAVPAPAAPAADMFQSQSSPPPNAVGSILFTSQRDGWAFGPALWRTTDGGALWRRERVPGPVANLEVAGGRMLAVVTRTGKSGNTDLRLYAARAGTDDWRPVPGAAVSDFFGESLAVSGGTGYLTASRNDLARPVLLTGPVAGPARWHTLPEPCPGGWSVALAAVPGWLFTGCGSEPGAGNQLKTAFVSRDGGRTWHRVANPPMGGYLGGATMSAGGTIFLSGERMDIYISRDRGRSWHESPSLENAAVLADAGFFLVATAVTDKVGVAFEKGVGTQQVWLTRDGGRRWTPVTVH